MTAAGSLRKPIQRRFLALGCLLAAVAAAAFLFDGRWTAAAGTAMRWAAPAIGLAADRVTLSGHRMTSDRDIYDAMDGGLHRQLTRFDLASAKRRIEALPWVLRAELRATFPNGVEVRIVERAAYAVHRRPGGDRLVDAEGRALGAIPPGSAPHLPVVAGDGAPQAARAMLSALAHHPLRNDLSVLERVGNRRWTLRLRNGAAIHLPAGREAAALAAIRDGAVSRLAEAGAVLDLRRKDATPVRRAKPPLS